MSDEAIFIEKLTNIRKGNSKALSSLKMSNEDKGMLLRDISGKCDIGNLMLDVCEDKKTKLILLHRRIMNSFFDAVGNSGNRPKKVVIDPKDKYAPPAKGWSKVAFKEIEATIGKSVVEGFVKELMILNKDPKKVKLEDCLMKMKEYRSAALCDKGRENKKAPTKKLDDWQQEVIDHFVSTKCKNSLLLLGPTSGGKTYVSMGVIQEAVSSMESGIVGFVSPNFYLAIQTYSTILSTFTNVKNSCLLTAGLQEMSSIDKPGVKILVGTPKEMWNLCESDKDFKFNLLVIDEIHMMGSNNVDPMIKVCMSCLLSRTSNIFGLSATINPDSVKSLLEHFKQHTGEEPSYIKYTERPVPLYSDTITMPVTEENTAKFLINLKNKRRTPCLVFDSDNEICLEQYKNLISYLENENKVQFRGWNSMIDDVNCIVADYNNNNISTIMQFRKAHSMNNERFLDAIGASVSSSKKSKEAALNKILDSLQCIFMNSYDLNKYNVKVNELESQKISLIRELKIKNKEISIDSSMVLEYLIEYRNVFSKITSAKSHKNMVPEDIELLDFIPEGPSPYLHIGKTDGSKKLSDILTKDSDKERRIMLKLCESERCKESDIKPVFELVASGLRFGIGILIETIPYAVQIKIMQLLQSKEIDIIFASQSMRMGINFPIKSCIIRQMNNSYIPVDFLMQMSGRAGRRGYDKEGYVYYWNVENHDKVCLGELEQLVLEYPDVKKSHYVDEPNELAYTIHTLIDDGDKITTHINNMNKAIRDKKRLETINNNAMNETEMSKIEKEEKEQYTYYDETTGWDDKSNDKTDKELMKDMKKVMRNSEEEEDIVDDIKCVIAAISNHIDREDLTDQSADLATVLYELIHADKVQVRDTIKIRKAINDYSSILQELYMRYRISKARKFLEKLENIFEILQQIKYRVV